MENHKSYISQIHDRLENILIRFDKILGASRTEPYTIQSHPMAGSKKTTKYTWAKLPPDLEREQNQIIKDFDEWYVDFSNLFVNLTRDEDARIKKFYTNTSNWIKYRGDPFSDITKESIRVRGEYVSILVPLQVLSQTDPVFVVDTNVIIECPDLLQMSTLIKASKAIFAITTTTLAELDELKNNKRDEAFKKKLKIAIKYLETITENGDVIEGIKITDNITVKILVAEPDFSNLPTWLNKDTKDDKIIASSIELQRKYHGSVVTILTNDINMRTKAKAAKILAVSVPLPAEQ